MKIDFKELVIVSKAVELLHYGVDITKLDSIMNQYYNPKTKALQSRISDNIVNFHIRYSDKVMEFMDNFLGNNVIRSASSYVEVFDDSLTPEEIALTTVEVDIKEFKQIMVILKEKGFADFVNFDRYDYDEEYLKNLEEIRKSFDYTIPPTCDMVNDLSKNNTRRNLEILIQFSKYSKEIGTNMLNAFDEENKDFGLTSLEKFPIIDNRMYIRLSAYDKEELNQIYSRSSMSLPKDLKDLEYIVISRNPYDFYFCSYGSNIQSCYSLSSTHYGWYGFVPLSQFDGTFIIYGTSGKANKINLLNGIKWAVPRMLYRSWGWQSTDGRLMLDRVYIGNDANEEVRKRINDWFNKLFLHYDMKYYEPCDVPLVSSEEYAEFFDKENLRFYPDSINFCKDKADCHYKGICYGDREFVGRVMPLSTIMTNSLSSVSNVDDSYHFCDNFMVLNGTLKSVKLCPVTSLPIGENEEKSKFANMFVHPVSNVVVVTYIDGFYHIDEASKQTFIDSKIEYSTNIDRADPSTRECGKIIFTKKFNSPTRYINIRTFKELMTSYVKECKEIDAVIVRYIEGDKVYYVKYRRQ